MMCRHVITAVCLGLLLWPNVFLGSPSTVQAETIENYSLLPPFVTAGVPPLVMLVMGKNHKLFYEAYNDASDLDGDGNLDVGYKPAIDYFGYFDSHKEYIYDSSDDRFEPVAYTADKKVTATNRWSGDFLNYLTMSRMDCLRKVLYGGYRSTDTASETVLERAYIPQDGHSWGKEYASIPHDGYDIREYSPLGIPAEGARHLFISTTLSDGGEPLLRVLTNTAARVWDWVSIERPVACLDADGGGRTCDFAFEPSGNDGSWNVVPESMFSNLDIKIYDHGYNVYHSSPSSYSAFNSLVALAQDSGLTASGTISKIDSDVSPYGEDRAEYYVTLVSGELIITTSADYTFSADGDDAVDFLIDLDNDGSFESDEVIAGWYNAHDDSNGNMNTVNNHKGSPVYLEAGNYNVLFRHQEKTGGDNFKLWMYTEGSNTSTDYEVRVQVAVDNNDVDPEENCKIYPNGNYKPIGMLQKFGEPGTMYFGLITGSYTNNMSGGVLRKNCDTITDEINLQTGEFAYLDDGDIDGLIKSLDRIAISDFNYGSSYSYSTGLLMNRPMNEGEAPDWGNPVGEMMYEALRYFSGKGSATATFVDGVSDGNDDGMLLPLESWSDPYTDRCANAFMLVLSDIYPNYDSDSVPGSDFSSFSGDISSLDAGSLADIIGDHEGVHGHNYFIGQSTSGNADSAPTAKTINSLGNARGLAPEEPSKQGSYYSSAMAYFGNTTDLRTGVGMDGDQVVKTIAVGLSSPLPKINIPVKTSPDASPQIVTVLPFAKSVANGGTWYGSGDFQPTNTIVDFYVDTITPTSGKFRINFEDVEQANDHDMDAIAFFEYEVKNNESSSAEIEISVTPEYEAGSVIHHIGYIISGTTDDGVHLVVRDANSDGSRNNSSDDDDYFLDDKDSNTFPEEAGAPAEGLPWVKVTDTYTPDPAGAAASYLQNPLWYAAKYGGFDDLDGDNLPDDGEWNGDGIDKDGDGSVDPDNYFYVQNPLYLQDQLVGAFTEVLKRVSSGTAASVISNSRSGEGAVYQSIFFPSYPGKDGEDLFWVGQTHALFVDAFGNMREDNPDSGTPGKLDLAYDRIIKFDTDGQRAIAYLYNDINSNGLLDSAEEADSNREMVEDISLLNHLWSSSNWLNSKQMDSNILSQRSSANYISAQKERYIFTFVDANSNALYTSGIPDSGEIMAFTTDNLGAIGPYMHGRFPFESDQPGYLSGATSGELADFYINQKTRLIKYIRGEDQASYTLPLNGSDTEVPAYRSRQMQDGSTWRLGDIIHSSPTIVGRPTEDYDLLYQDVTYSSFYRQYLHRRQVVYVGANDGMLHAFNAGFFDSTEKRFYTAFGDHDNDTETPDTFYDDVNSPPLGAELWAYVPFNLLPHLHWLACPSYNADEYHISYMDLKPRIFDVKTFSVDSTHSAGWGTLMVAGMRLGGGELTFDTDENDERWIDTNGDGLDTDNNGDPEPLERSSYPAYVIMDITNPEEPPTLLAEVAFEELGYTTCYPTPILMRDSGTSGSSNNAWYLLFGSGPHPAKETTTQKTLSEGISDQHGNIYLLSLNKLCSGNGIWTLDSSGSLVEGTVAFSTLTENNSFVSDPISVDWDFDYKADTAYFGTVSGSFTQGWKGKLKRLVLNNDVDTSNWYINTLMDLSSEHDGQPIVVAPTIAKDTSGERWIFFGTGRFYNRNDATDTVDSTGDLATALSQQSFYGVKEYRDESGLFTYPDADSLQAGYISTVNLLDVSSAKVYSGIQTVTGVSGDVSSFSGLVSEVTDPATQGWMLDFPESLALDDAAERVLGQPTLLGDILSFTTYVPSDDPCTFEGKSKLYALYYKTGTAYFSSVIGLEDEDVAEDINDDGIVDQEVLREKDIGIGLSVTPNIHTGRGKDSKLFIQTSTGAIEIEQESNPGIFKTGTISWESEGGGI